MRTLARRACRAREARVSDDPLRAGPTRPGDRPSSGRIAPTWKPRALVARWAALFVASALRTQGAAGRRSLGPVTVGRVSRAARGQGYLAPSAIHLRSVSSSASDRVTFPPGGICAVLHGLFGSDDTQPAAAALPDAFKYR